MIFIPFSIEKCINYLRLFERWDRGCEFHSKHVCVRLFCFCIVLCVGYGPSTG
jgi:hypothetical protein